MLPASAKSECCRLLLMDSVVLLCCTKTSCSLSLFDHTTGEGGSLLAMPLTQPYSESAPPAACAITWKPAFRHPHILPLQPMALLHPRLALTGASPTWPAENRNEANELPRNKSHCGTKTNFQSLLNGAFPSPSPRLNRALCLTGAGGTNVFLSLSNTHSTR